MYSYAVRFSFTEMQAPTLAKSFAESEIKTSNISLELFCEDGGLVKGKNARITNSR